jgi:repressor LexA
VTRHDAERKRKIMDVIAATIRARGYPPSVREIAKAVGLASTSAVHHHLQILEKDGYLERGAAQSRAIRLTPHAALMMGLGPELTPQSVPSE